jgi:hypothetical protein
MKTLLFVIALICSALADEGRQAKLDELKRNFPQHTAGPVTDRTDPAIREYFFKYRKMAMALTLEELPEQMGELRRTLDADIQFSERDGWGNVATPSLKHARRTTATWLKGSLKAWVVRLESFQRGR